MQLFVFFSKILILKFIFNLHTSIYTIYKYIHYIQVYTLYTSIYTIYKYIHYIQVYYISLCSKVLFLTLL